MKSRQRSCGHATHSGLVLISATARTTSADDDMSVAWVGRAAVALPSNSASAREAGSWGRAVLQAPSARAHPTHHQDNWCGWHPTAFDGPSGRALYRWRVNQVLDQAGFEFQIATAGPNAGRMVRAAPVGLDKMVSDMLEGGASCPEVAQAIAMSRRRGASREDRRSAVVSLAGMLEARRPVLKDCLSREDEAALFEIANCFGLRHRNEAQQGDYGVEFLEWVFYWYLSTVHLTEQLLARRGGG